ncbi:MAG: translocation/assembly module TamB domain-containing protein [Terracidiphilus sp.]
MAGSAAIVTFAASAALILLHSQRFHNYLIVVLERQAGSKLGVQVNLENYALHLATLSVDLYGIKVDGAAPYSNLPLLEASHVEAGVRIVSILRHEWYLDDLRVDHPVVRIVVDKQGNSNIPKFNNSGSPPNPNEVFDLGIRHAALDNGEVSYNNRPSQLSADLQNVEFHTLFNSPLREYSGRLGYSNGRLVYGSFQPVSHDLFAEFNATPSTFNLTKAQLSIGPSRAILSATLRSYVAPIVQAHYDIIVDGKQAGRILHNDSIPAGLIQTAGSIQYRQDPNLTLAESLVVNGSVSSRRLDFVFAARHAEIDRIAAKYTFANGEVVLHELTARCLGGLIKTSGTMAVNGHDPHSEMTVKLSGISLDELNRTLGRTAQMGNVVLTGTLDADATASWGKTLADLVVHANATIDGQVSGAQVTLKQATDMNNGGFRPSVIPVESAIHGTYFANMHQLELRESYIRTTQTDLTMNGVLSQSSNLNIQLQVNDLREVEAFADLFRTGSLEHPLQPLGLAGSAAFQGTVRGSTSAPHLAGQLRASNLQLKGSTWKTIRASLGASPSSVTVRDAELDPARQGRIAFNASADLNQWAFTDTSNIQVDLHASQLNVAELIKIAGQQAPVTGTLDVNVTLHGTELNPIGKGTVTLTKSTLYSQPVNSIKLNFSGSGDEVHGQLAAQSPAGTVDCEATVQPKQRIFTAQVNSSGIELNKLEALHARNINAAGVVTINAKGQGSFDNPQFDATLKIPKLVIRNQSVTGIDLQANLANHVVNATLESTAVNTLIQAKAKVNLTGDYEADASLDTQLIQLQPLLAAYSPDEASDVSGQTEVHATLHGPLKDKNRIEAHVTIPVLKFGYGYRVQLAAQSPIRVDYLNGVINLQRAEISGTDTDLQLQGSIPISTNGPMSLLLQGSVNLQLAQLFDPDVRSSGELKFNINSHGVASGPDLGGEIDIVDANFSSAGVPAALAHGNGVLKVTNNRIDIASFQGSVGGGTVTAHGGVAYRPNMRFDLGMAAHGVRILYPQGMRESIDSNLRFTGTAENAVLGGSVDLSDLSFTPAFDLTSLIGQFSGGVVAPPSLGFAQNVQLNLAVHSTNNVNLVSRALSVGGAANLEVRGTADAPVLLGRIDLTNGDVILNGERFVLNGGTVQFVNPSQTEPVVNLSVGTSIQQYDITLRFQGPVDQLQTQYTSNPALPQADIINLLAFGQTTEASAATATPANQQAESLIASQVSSQVTSRISKIAGISQLSISPVLANSSAQGPAGANITIQQRVTGNLFVTFSSNVATTQSQTIQGQYQISPRVAISATRDSNGGFAFDTLIKKSW